MAELVNSRGWKQGDILQGSAVRILLQENVDKGVPEEPVPEMFVVCSQDCDLVASCEKEPWVELLGATTCLAVENNVLNGRNPRNLQVQWEERYLDFNIHCKIKIPKHFISNENLKPQLSLDPETLNIVLRWLSRRFIRPAYPDAFNARLVPQKKTLE